MKSFELDSEVRYNAFYLYTFSDRAGKEYLSFLNYRTNQLCFYDWTTNQFLFKVNLDAEGPDGVSQVSGYYVQDFDHIYVSSYGYNGLMRVDTTGHVLQKIPYGKTESGYTVIPSYTPSSHPYIAPIIPVCLAQDGLYGRKEGLGLRKDGLYISQNGLLSVESFTPSPFFYAFDF